MLENIIKEQIKKRGVIGFDEFMHLALYHPHYGYYRSCAPKLGKAGDFITAPEISDTFGYSLARQIMTIGGDILEFGAGSGVLAAQILYYLQQHSQLPEYYYILELSATLKQQQERNILTVVPELKGRIIWLDTLPQQFYGTIIANEVLDAMPTKRAILQKGVLRELGVGLKHNELIWQIQDAVLDDTHPHLVEGYTTEINLQNLAWIDSLSTISGAFVALLIDYGYSDVEFFHPERTSGTLRCYHKHQADDNPFVDIGNKDITSWVNFSAIMHQAQQSGLKVLGYSTQMMMLISLGIMDFLAQKEGKERLRLLAEIKQLIMPEQMGESFKLLALAKNKDIKLQAFNEQNLISKL